MLGTGFIVGKLFAQAIYGINIIINILDNIITITFLKRTYLCNS